MRSIAFASLVGLALGPIACAPPGTDVPDDVFGHCIYTNRFSDGEECMELRGTGWDADSAQEACDAQSATLVLGPCPYDGTMGACVMPSDDATKVTQLVVPAGDPADCASNERGCELFGGGTFVPGSVCGGDDVPDPDEAYDADNYYVPEILECREPLDGEPGQSDGSVCTWSQMSGCTEEGRAYEDYGSCDIVRTQRPYSAVPPDDTQPAVDPRMNDATYAAEVSWVKSQLESCACVCCHKDSITPEGAAIWDTEHEDNFANSFTPWGLGFAARAFDSSLLGNFRPEENNGFSRDVAGLPSTDQPRMKRFFEGELEHRGLTVADFADEPPAPFVFYDQSIYEPVACAEGEGIDDDDVVRWVGGRARYVYVLDEGSVNPGLPPNLDVPAGTRWRIDTVPPAIPVKTGELVYGVVPEGHREEVPPTPLTVGDRYILFVLADIGVPITRCVFTR